MVDPLVSVIVPTYNRPEQVLRCLEAVSRLDYEPYEIVVVDSGSTDDTVARVAGSYPDVKLVQLDDNVGASGSRNAGMRNAEGVYFYFIDSDVLVEPNALSALVKVAEDDERVGVVGSRMFYYCDKEKPYFAGAFINLNTSRTTYKRLYDSDDDTVPTEHVPCTWMIRRSVVEEIGVMDTDYHTYYEESDWHGRVARAGYKLVVSRDAIAYHDVPYSESIKKVLMRRGTTSDKGSVYYAYHMARNRAVFMRKFATRANYLLFLLTYNNLFLFMYLSVFARNLSLKLFCAYLRGYLAGIVKAWSVIRIADGTEDQARLPL